MAISDGPRGRAKSKVSFQTGSRVCFCTEDALATPPTENVIRGSEDPPDETRFLSATGKPRPRKRPIRNSFGGFSFETSSAKGSNDSTGLNHHCSATCTWPVSRAYHFRAAFRDLPNGARSIVKSPMASAPDKESTSSQTHFNEASPCGENGITNCSCQIGSRHLEMVCDFNSGNPVAKKRMRGSEDPPLESKFWSRIARPKPRTNAIRNSFGSSLG
mmetsp:Transcript_11540/g.38556  ORF Transcript_11540/g.38556 Transcript_11540/m.38556 type:complete len:217 (-) Transcript_11540:1371-2021(-)